MNLLRTVVARWPRALVVTAIAAGVITQASAQSGKNIAEVASSNESFTALVTALAKADLVGAVSADGPFTVFAPTNDAFAKIDPKTLESLLLPENKGALTQILTYHVVPGRITGAQALEAGSLTTLQGEALNVRFVDGTLRVNDSKIVSIDIPASNGVIHVIDGVLLPPETNQNGTATRVGGPKAARDLIARAIARGVPLFNEGQVEACVSVYGITCRALLGIGANDVPDAVLGVIRAALDEANATHDQRDRAWILRRALDRADAILAGEKMMEPRSDTTSSSDVIGRRLREVSKRAGFGLSRA